MTDAHKELAEKGLREKLAELEADLDRVLRVRTAVERSIEEAEDRVRSQTAQLSDVLQQEGRLRREIGDMRQALDAFRSS